MFHQLTTFQIAKTGMAHLLFGAHNASTAATLPMTHHKLRDLHRSAQMKVPMLDGLTLGFPETLLRLRCSKFETCVALGPFRTLKLLGLVPGTALARWQGLASSCCCWSLSASCLLAGADT